MGCASLDDFKKMSPLQRAEKVCGKQARNNQNNNEIDRLKSAAQEITLNINRGYELQENCTYVERMEPTTFRCSSSTGLSSYCREDTYLTRNLDGSHVYSCKELHSALNGKVTIYSNTGQALDMNYIANLLRFRCDKKCISHHVPLDTSSLRKERNNILLAIESLQRKISDDYTACFSRVVGMDSDQAYSSYKSGHINNTSYQTNPSNNETGNIGNPCKVDTECPGRLVCRQKSCTTPFDISNPAIPQCKVDIHCPGTSLCRGGKCVNLQ